MPAQVRFRGTLTGDDGSSLVINDAVMTPGPTGPSGPSGPTGPVDLNTVVIGAATYPLSGINPTGTAFPGGRGVDQLVLYTAPVTVTVTNPWGAEVPVVTGVCGIVNDRASTGSTTGTPVPAGGSVLSGHGAAHDWLIANATTGAHISLTHTDRATGPTGVSGPTGSTGPAVGGQTLAVYLMMWPGSGVMDQVPPECNEVRLAFAQGSPPSLVGWTSDGQQQLVAKLAAFRAQGKRVLVSVGGQGGGANPGDHSAFLAGIANIRGALGGNLDGVDWDLEAVAMNAADIVAINSALKLRYGLSFRVTFAPNGGNVAAYLAAAVACQQAGCLDGYGQQFYDANVSVAAALGRIREAMAAGIPANKITVGNMIANDSNHWTNDQCVQNYQALKAAVPQLAGAYLWETHRDGTAQWATQVGALVFG